MFEPPGSGVFYTINIILWISMISILTKHLWSNNDQVVNVVPDLGRKTLTIFASPRMICLVSMIFGSNSNKLSNLQKWLVGLGSFSMLF